MFPTWRPSYFTFARHLIIRCQSTASSTAAFSDHRSAQFLAAAAEWATVPKLQGLPEVIVTGRANVGKSTLLNAVLGRTSLLNTSKKPGRTQTLNFYRVGPEPGHLIVVDAPGYGKRGRPEWGELFDSYIENRPVLRRVYILFNGKHGLNEVDRIMLQSLEEKCQSQEGANHWTLQAIITKADTMEGDMRGAIQKIQGDIFETAPTCLPGIITASSKRAQFGIDVVRLSMVEACGLGRVQGTIQ